MQMFPTAFVLCIFRLFKLKTGGQTFMTEKLSLILGSLNRALNNPA